MTLIASGVVSFPDARQRAQLEATTIAQAGRGDQRAFERLYRTHAGWVFGLCLRMSASHETAQDCTQETFIAAWRALPGFEQRSQFATWLHRIAVNTVLGRRRRSQPSERLHVEAPEAEIEAVVGSVDAPGPIDLERAIAQLPQGARDVLVLVGLYGHSHEEAAATLGVAVGTCKSQLHRARALLAARLGLESEES